MAETTKPKFTFESKAVDKNTFNVVNFKGTEGLSTIYRFNILLISDKADLDLGTILQNPAELTIKRDDGDIPFKGVLCSFEQMHQAAGMVFYRAELVPHLWRTTLTYYNEIFLNKDAKQMLGEALNSAGMKQGLTFDFKLQESYPTKEYVCQYDESYFNFVSRWMERDGMYYYFEQTDQGEKMIITDTHISHSPMSEGTFLSYSPPSNLDHSRREEVVKNFMLKQQPLPKKVLLKDYNYRKPSLEMKAEYVVSEQGMGDIYIYGEHFSSTGEGQTLAKIRAEEFLSREKIFHGVSTVPYVRSGYIFEMKDHYRQDFNQRYLTTEVVHEGSQEAYLVSGLGLHLADNEDRLYYRNTFTCIPANTQFRAERKAEKPKFSGTMNAKIDAAGSGKYAELDSQGRYKVILPFDESGRNQGKATTWLRMAQPYGGADHGMHFPLHKGTEVLLTCIDGDPDRPIIQAAAPNPENPSLITDTNQTKCIIATGGQNIIHLQDKEGSQGIHLKTPTSNTNLRLGSSETESESGDGEEEGVWLQTEKDIKMKSGKSFGTWVGGHEFKIVTGSSEEIIVGNDTKIFLILKEDFVAGMETGVKMGGTAEFAPLHKELHGESTKLKGELEELNAEQTRMSIDMTNLNATCADMNGELTDLRGEHNTLAGSHNKLKGETSKLAGEASKLAGQVNEVWGEVDTVAGNLTHLCGEVTALAGEDNKIVGVMAKSIGDSTKLIGTCSNVTAETSEISGEMNNIAGLINNI